MDNHGKLLTKKNKQKLKTSYLEQLLDEESSGLWVDEVDSGVHAV